MEKYAQIIKQNEPVLKKGNTSIYLVDFEEENELLQYIGKLRWEIYRSTGAGYSGTDTDLDSYDLRVTHVLIWDEENNEIIGGYRLFKCWELITKGVPDTYLSENFNFHEDYFNNLNISMEVGRSFIQEKYWNGNYLDHLWMGIGQYLLRNPNVKYLYGSVSIGTLYSLESISYIIYHYKKWHWQENNFFSPKKEFEINQENLKKCEELFSGSNSDDDLRKLKFKLRDMGLSIPVLMRRYVSLTDLGGTRFLAFAYDDAYDSIVSLCQVDITKLKDIYHKRYLGES